MADSVVAFSDTIDDIASAISEGKCILFLGAAVHCGPPDGSRYAYPPAHRPPLGGALSEYLAAKSGFLKRYPGANTRDLQRVALDFEIKKDRTLLVEEIRDQIDKGTRPSPILRGLAQMNFPLIVTTNYDPLIDRALAAAGKQPVLSVYKNNEKATEPTDDYPYDKLTPERPFLLKIHGDIVQRPDSIVVTDEDYIQFVLRMSDQGQYYPIPETFLFHFKRWRTLFVGYSLMDYNLRLLFKTLRWRIIKGAPPTYSVDLSPDPLIYDVWHNQRRYVNWVVQDIWTFVPDLYRRLFSQDMPE